MLSPRPELLIVATYSSRLGFEQSVRPRPDIFETCRDFTKLLSAPNLALSYLQDFTSDDGEEGSDECGRVDLIFPGPVCGVDSDHQPEQSDL